MESQKSCEKSVVCTHSYTLAANTAYRDLRKRSVFSNDICAVVAQKLPRARTGSNLARLPVVAHFRRW